jgi:WD40 repeat protein
MGFTSIWDDQTLEEVTRLGTWDAGVSTSIFDWAIPAEWSPDGAQLITGHGDGHVRVWDVATEQVLLDLVANEYPLEETSDSTALFTKGVEDVGFTSDGRFLQAISRDGTVRQWDSVTGDLLDSYQLQDISYPLFAAAFSPDETQIAYAGDANSIHIIEPFPAR